MLRYPPVYRLPFNFLYGYFRLVYILSSRESFIQEIPVSSKDNKYLLILLLFWFVYLTFSSMWAYDVRYGVYPCKFNTFHCVLLRNSSCLFTHLSTHPMWAYYHYLLWIKIPPYSFHLFFSKILGSNYPSSQKHSYEFYWNCFI